MYLGQRYDCSSVTSVARFLRGLSLGQRCDCSSVTSVARFLRGLSLGQRYDCSSVTSVARIHGRCLWDTSNHFVDRIPSYNYLSLLLAYITIDNCVISCCNTNNVPSR